MKGIKDIELEDKVPSLETIVFNEFDKIGITPSNTEWKVMKTLSSAIEEYIHLREQNYNKRVESWISNEYSKELQNWLCNTYAEELQNWLVEDFIPSLHKFNYWAAKEFPKTFNKIISNENEDVEENIEEAEYEEIKSND